MNLTDHVAHLDDEAAVTLTRRQWGSVLKALDDRLVHLADSTKANPNAAANVTRIIETVEEQLS